MTRYKYRRAWIVDWEDWILKVPDLDDTPMWWTWVGSYPDHGMFQRRWTRSVGWGS